MLLANQAYFDAGVQLRPCRVRGHGRRVESARECEARTIAKREPGTACGKPKAADITCVLRSERLDREGAVEDPCVGKPSDELFGRHPAISARAQNLGEVDRRDACAYGKEIRDDFSAGLAVQVREDSRGVEDRRHELVGILAPRLCAALGDQLVDHGVATGCKVSEQAESLRRHGSIRA